MTQIIDDNISFREKVYEIVGDIPYGFVSTYGIIALIAGRPRGARMVGRFMSQAPRDTCSHRVVNHMGRTVPGWDEQRTLLENEGIAFNENGCVNLKKHLWRT